ncbi:MFS transporter [Novosphingobium piscinae]|uniref:MFS transporter n=1 Tax=Novosphingobium piscinae TaxID=1507448 RepID=A0A7X1FVG4_9SPHN|nr:MFS transporter [Novosphingobium piscinae]MBC2667614.1 MFS transporter [Novosphingobium piscinae]
MTVAIASGAQPTRARFGILALIATATALNYLDRTLLGVAAPAMSRELGFSPEMMGVVFAAFSWSYALAQVPGGVFLDRFGTRLTYGLSLVGWSVFTVLQGTVRSASMLILVRLGLGAAEAPCFPANSRVLITWFPRRERARANSVYSVGMYFGIGFCSPLLFWIAATWGWRALFWAIGGLGIGFGLVWFRLYRDPADHPSVNAAELALIRADGGVTEIAPPRPFRWSDAAYLLRQRNIIGASIGQFATNSTLVFFLTWFPTYLASERHMDWMKAGVFAMIPFVAASVGVLAGGQVSDRLLRAGHSLSLARKLPVIAGLLLSTTIVLAIVLESDAAVIAVMSLAFFGQGMSNLGWTLLSEVAPARLAGLTGGLFNLCTNLAGIITPLVIGVTVGRTGSFGSGLAYIGAMATLGALSYAFIVRTVERLPDPDAMSAGT